MPYTIAAPAVPCPICDSSANVKKQMYGTFVDCSGCGDFQMARHVADDLRPLADAKAKSIARYTIKRMQSPGKRPDLDTSFFESLANAHLPTPAEAIDNLLVWIAEMADARPSAEIDVPESHPALLGQIGAVEPNDIRWMVGSLEKQKLLTATYGSTARCILTAEGWRCYEELKRARAVSHFAFFARKFSNPELDTVFEKCLRPAVASTGYELQTVTQKAGLVDSIIEDEIRRCRFLIADLSDGNAGAYWEAGFAEGLGKPVFYVCKVGTQAHFDTDHRHTIKWSLSSLDETAAKLAAAIRNTLLGDAT